MLSYNQIVLGTYIVLEDVPYAVLSSTIVKKQRQKPTNQTKLKNLISGNVIEKAFHQSDAVAEAGLEKIPAKYLYSNRGESWFSNPEDPKDRFSLPTDTIVGKLLYLKENGVVETLQFDGKIIDVVIPIKVDLLVTEAAPAVRGNTAQGATKKVTLETGVVVETPLFINEGDTVRINTETGQYTERAEKK